MTLSRQDYKGRIKTDRQMIDSFVWQFGYKSEEDKVWFNGKLMAIKDCAPMIKAWCIRRWSIYMVRPFYDTESAEYAVMDWVMMTDEEIMQASLPDERAIQDRHGKKAPENFGKEA